MLNCLNELDDIVKRQEKERRKLFLRKHFKLYKKFDDWFSSCEFTQKRKAKKQLELEQSNKRIKELIESLN